MLSVAYNPFMLSVIMLNVVMLSAVLLSTVMLSVIMLNHLYCVSLMLSVTYKSFMLSVIMLSVAAPCFCNLMKNCYPILQIIFLSLGKVFFFTILLQKKFYEIVSLTFLTLFCNTYFSKRS
jgi:hypothetical protein